jgi:hypothetical protein
VQQAAAACANYFLWNDFLTGGNDDTAEGGYADRNYYGRALACSLAALNRRPLASAGMWGMPPAVRRRMAAVSAVYGAGGHPTFRAVVDFAPREVEVLFLYPQDLVAVEEVFGSWIVQYGYANYATAGKVVEYGSVTEDGRLAVKDARYRAVAVLYEPFPGEALLGLLREFVSRGGTVIWTSLPPLEVGAREAVADLCGVRFEATTDPLGLALPGRRVTFDGALAVVPPQTTLTDFVVDRFFPLAPGDDAEVVAQVHTGGPEGAVCVGARKVYPGGGQALCLGFRPRDDQAASTGVEARTWFEVLRALGAYPGADHPVVLSRTTDLLASTFPNGTVALCPHYRRHAESWPGGFYRDAELDEALLAENPPPDDAIALEALSVAGQTVSYVGRHAVAWRCDGQGRLRAFAGSACTGITLDGVAYRWSEAPVDLAWHPLGEAFATEDVVPLYRIWVGVTGDVRVPLALPEGDVEVWLGAYKPGRTPAEEPVHSRVGYGARRVAFELGEDGALQMTVDTATVGHWLYVVKRS